jgi:hypothetical protein
MKRTGIFLASLLFAWPGSAAPPAPKKPAKAAPSHKSKLPVTVSTVFGEGKATVTLRFDQAVEEAAIGVRGLDGLQVAELPPLARTSFGKGEILTLEVPIAPGIGQSHLAVDILGRFRGQRRGGVQTFSIGKPSAEQLKAGSGNILVTDGGQRIKVMPVNPE